MSAMPPAALKPEGTAINGFPRNAGDGWWGDGQGLSGGVTFPIAAPKIGLLAFLATAALLFSMLFSAYLGDIDHAGNPGWRSLPLPEILWLNTIMLLLGGGALQAAWIAARRGHEGVLRWGLLAAGILTSLFVLGQLAAWRQLAAAGVFLASNPSSSFFYLITAVHGLHVLGGLIAGVRTTARAWKGVYTPQNHLGVQLCAIYWHFLLLVWLIIFGLIWWT